MLAELQGLSGGGGGLGSGNVGLAGLGGGGVAGLSSLLPGVGASTGVPPALQGNTGGANCGAAASGVYGAQAVSDGSSKTSPKQSRTTGGGGVGAEWDATVLGEAGSGETLTLRNREYRQRMIEMDAEHKVRVGASSMGWRQSGGGLQLSNSSCWPVRGMASTWTRLYDKISPYGMYLHLNCYFNATFF